MAEQVIPEEAVNAAYERVQYYMDDMAPAEVQDVLKMALEAGAPYMLAKTWDEGYDRAESDHYGTGFWTKRLRGNPYRKPTDAHQ